MLLVLVNTPIYIGMDANTDNLSSSSLSQVSLSQRWFDIGSHFAYLQNDIPSPTCFAKGNPAGRRIDYIFANSPAVTAIQEFSLETAIPIPTHKPLCITIQVHLFSSSVTRLALPPTTHTFPRPTTHFLNVFTKLFQWDIQAFGGDVEQAYSCWNEWAQQYLTLLTNTTFHSRGTTPCIRKGLLALPLARELPNSKRPFITLYNRTISAISELHINPDCLNTPRFRTFLSQIATEAVSLLHNFVLLDDPHQWLPQLREALLVHRLTEQATIRQQRKTAWQSWIKDTWALNSKKIYQLIKGKFVEPFTCLQTENGLITDRTQIDALLQAAWNPIFAKYPTPEDKASEYRNSFYPYESPFPTFSLPPLTLDDFHYVLSKKLKPSAATGLDGWRPLEIKQLPDCLLQALLDVFHLCETQKKFPSSFYYSYTTLIPKGPSRAPLSLRPITVLPVPYRILLALDAKPCSIGKILGYILLSSPSVKGVAPLASIVPYLLICCNVIKTVNLLLVFNLILLNALTPFPLALFGTFCFTTAVMSTLSLFYKIFIVICLVAFDMRVVSAHFGKLPMVYYKGTLLVWLF